MPEFRVVSDYKLMGDQPQAVEKIADGILQGKRAQTLMGVTGPVRLLLWLISSSVSRNLLWSSAIIRLWLHSFMENSRSSSLRMQWSILFPSVGDWIIRLRKNYF